MRQGRNIMSQIDKSSMQRWNKSFKYVFDRMTQSIYKLLGHYSVFSLIKKREVRCYPWL